MTRGKREERRGKRRRRRGKREERIKKKKESPANAAKRIAILRSGGGGGALIQALIGLVWQQRGNNNASNFLLQNQTKACVQASWAKKAEGGEAGRLIVLLAEEQILCVCRALGAHRGEASKQTNMTDSGFRTRLRQPLQGHQLDSAMTTGKKFVGEG